MGFYVHIHVCFACDTNAGVAEVAKKHLPSIVDEGDGERAARWFLESLSERTGHNHGPKGGLSLWGMVGNYTQGDRFCECLRPFWEELLTGFEGGPCTHERVIVFEEREQSEAADAFEIGWDDPHTELRTLQITKHSRLPFSWQQF